MDKWIAIIKTFGSMKALSLFIATGATLATAIMFASQLRDESSTAFHIKTGLWELTYRAHDPSAPSAKSLRDMTQQERESTLAKTYKAPSASNVGYITEYAHDQAYRLDASAHGKNAMLVSSSYNVAKLIESHDNGVDYMELERLSDTTFRQVSYTKWKNGRIEYHDDQIARWLDDDYMKALGSRHGKERVVH